MLTISGKSALVDHGWQMGHLIQYNKTKVVYQSGVWKKRLVREALAIQTTSGVFNKEDGARLSTVWFPAIELMRKLPSATVGVLTGAST